MADAAPIAVVSPSGKVGEIAPEHARDVLEAGGRGATPDEVATAKAQAEQDARTHALQEKYGSSFAKGLELHFGAGLAGGLRGLSGGLSDEALISGAGAFGGKAAEEDVRQRLNEYKEAAPGISAGSEIAGIVAPMLVGDEAGVAGVLKRGVPGAVSDVGRAGEGIAAHVLGSEATGLAGVAQRAIPKAVAGGLDGAAYGVGSQVSEDALGDHKHTAESLVAAAGHGFFWGGLLGGALGGGTAPNIEEHLAGKLGEGEGKLEGFLRDTGAEATPYRTPSVRSVAEDAEAATTDAMTPAEKRVGKAGFQALGGTAQQARTVGRNIEGGAEKVGLDFVRDVEAQTGKSFAFHDVNSAYEYAEKRTEQLGEKLGSMSKALDEAGTGIAPDAAAFAAKARKELVEPYIVRMDGETPVYLPHSEPIVKEIESHISQLERSFGDKPATFQQWQKSRQLLDKEINFAKANKSPAQQALEQYRGMMEDEFTSAGERAAQQMGQGFADEYNATKEIFRSVKTARDLLEGKVARQEYSNRKFSLGDMLGAIKGAVVGGVPGAVLGGVASHVGRTRGDFILAGALNKASKLEMLGGTAARVNGELTSGVRGLLGASAPEGGRIAAARKALPAAASMIAGKTHEEKAKNFKAQREALTAFQSNPSFAIDHLSKRLGQMPEYAPKTAAAVTDVVQRGASFLLSKMPPPRIDAQSLTPQFQDPSRTSPMELSRFARYRNAVEHPLAMLEDAKKGRLTRDQVEAVKAVYPEIYGRMQTEMLRQLSTAKSKLPYERQVQIGILLDIPTNRTMTPEFIKAIQDTYPASEIENPEEVGAMKPMGGPASMGKVDVASSVASAGDQLEMKTQ